MLAQGLDTGARLGRHQPGLVAPGAQALAPLLEQLRRQEIGLCEHQIHLDPGGFGREQETGELDRIEVGLHQGHHHHDPVAVGHRWPGQQAGAGCHRRHGAPAGGPINPLNLDPIADADLLARFAQPGATHAEQLVHPRRARGLQSHPAKISLHGHHQPAGNRAGRGGAVDPIRRLSPHGGRPTGARHRPPGP